MFIRLPKMVSAGFPSRGRNAAEGTINGAPFRCLLEPDGEGGHWMKIDEAVREAAGAEAGDEVVLTITPAAEEPEPEVPPDLKKALAAASERAREVWRDITPAARRDYVHWIISPKQAATRVRRIEAACDMLAKGKRRPCCFDRSGMYSKSQSCPVADDGVEVPRPARPQR